CQWGTCAETFNSPNDLYNHICEAHIGRKVTRNLCLQCSWQGCRYTGAKRDQITPHVRVHTKRATYTCAKCSHTTMRLSDFKKHAR
ncbi:hypothetical protein BZA05DRAFT_315558, partial [Tricharina praecox]|uniref:uncharacterized protein n=1 Tax=Tricharina praecox TaxID=43433 RepID=UPI0022211F09